MLWLLLLLSYDAQPKPDWRISQWPQDLGSIPCAAWRKDKFGAYAIKGLIEWEPGDLRMRDPSFRPESPEGRVMAAKCGLISPQ